MNMMVIILIVILLILLISWVIRTQNKLVHQDELCQNALSQIGVQQATRWDALTALAKQAQKYSEKEYQFLSGIIEKRQGIDRKTDAGTVDAQNDLLSQVSSRLMAVAEAYPEFKSADLYRKTMDGINQYEENVRYSRMIYNDTVTKLNRTVRSFPASMIAGMLGFGTKEYLATEEGKTQMPDLE